MDSHLQCALVDHNLCTLIVGRLGWNVPNACKRCIRSANTDVKGVQEPSRDSGGIGRMGNSFSSDLYCGKENTASLVWQGVSGIHGVESA